MYRTDTNFEQRLDRVIAWLLWITLALGVFASFVRDGPRPESYIALAAASGYVLLATAVPAHVQRIRLGREAMVVAGTVLTMTAIAATRNLSSPYLLLGLIPVLYAGAHGGFRAGLGAAALSSGILASVVVPQANPSWIELIRWTALVFLVAVTFGYARRLLTEESSRSEALVAASAETSSRLERLDSAHRLLKRLADRAESAELNPIEVGTVALDSVRGVVPFQAASITLLTDTGPLAVARSGNAGHNLLETAFPMLVGGREVGALVIGNERALSPSQVESVEAVLQPASLAFSNILLLQKIARIAIKEERSRLARELHDDIGPSLASLGLALDLAALQYPAEPALGAHLQDLRASVGRLVEDVRSTVTDLRANNAPSLREVVLQAIQSRDSDGPSIMFKVDERNPARPSLANEINAIVGEALRNAVRHSGATAIAVDGFIDFERGVVEISDNGTGFDPTHIPASSFGLIGMRERADAIGAELHHDSRPGRTTVSVKWGDK